jgi:hypothetical protein
MATKVRRKRKSELELLTGKPTKPKIADEVVGTREWYSSSLCVHNDGAIREMKEAAKDHSLLLGMRSLTAIIEKMDHFITATKDNDVVYCFPPTKTWSEVFSLWILATKHTSATDFRFYASARLDTRRSGVFSSNGVDETVFIEQFRLSTECKSIEKYVDDNKEKVYKRRSVSKYGFDWLYSDFMDLLWFYLTVDPFCDDRGIMGGVWGFIGERDPFETPLFPFMKNVYQETGIKVIYSLIQHALSKLLSLVNYEHMYLERVCEDQRFWSVLIQNFVHPLVVRSYVVSYQTQLERILFCYEYQERFTIYTSALIRLFDNVYFKGCGQRIMSFFL